ncbi:MAG: cobalamin-dependent protein [Gemmatimonadota bacterium]|nr:cobalamin-dependent protein [Gemmatimonadota bacterium]
MKGVPANTTKQSDPAQHPIALVADRTGLTQDVLRVWERRYGAVRPERGPGGQRLYTNADVERLNLLASAVAAGRSVGQIAGLPTRALARMVDEDTAARKTRPSSGGESVSEDEMVDIGLAHTRSLSSADLDDHLRRAAALLGVAAFVERVAVPLLRRVGDEWHAGRLTPSQEHLTSSILHDILVGTMRGFTQRGAASRVLVATPAGERHAIGAALVGASAAVEGWNVIYLGADLPAAEIAAAAIAADVTIVALSIVYVDDRERVLGEVRSLRARLPKNIAVIAGGSGATLLRRELVPSGVRVAGKIDELFSLANTDGS